MPHNASDFDALFRQNQDPWEFRTRWYESRKRALTLACLPQLRYANGYEPGCANGELSADLATRCDVLTVSDGSIVAVNMAAKRLANFPDVKVLHAWVPLQWPDETFDLIVISEFGFYMDAQALDGLADRITGSIRPGGTVMACHWRRAIEACEYSGDEVHKRLWSRMRAALPMVSLCHHLEPDMVLDVWSSDSRSIAQREGFA